MIRFFLNYDKKHLTNDFLPSSSSYSSSKRKPSNWRAPKRNCECSNPNSSCTNSKAPVNPPPRPVSARNTMLIINFLLRLPLVVPRRHPLPKAPRWSAPRPVASSAISIDPLLPRNWPSCLQFTITIICCTINSSNSTGN